MLRLQYIAQMLKVMAALQAVKQDTHKQRCWSVLPKCSLSKPLPNCGCAAAAELPELQAAHLPLALLFQHLLHRAMPNKLLK